jgi:hypothetical protein
MIPVSIRRASRSITSHATVNRMTSLYAGAARVDITPTRPILQAGFGQRTTPSTGVHDPLFAKALYLDDGRARVLIVTTDLICMPRPLADAVMAPLATATGLVRDEVLLCASHTHSGPVPWDGAGGSEYHGALVDALVRVGCDAVAAARRSRLRCGIGSADVFFNRRTRGAPNHVDRRIPVLAVEDAATGALHAVAFGAGCHPVTLGWDNMQISADFPGVAQAEVERALGVENALFFNTTEGNVIPVTSPDRDALDPRGYCGGGWEHTLSIGRAIADAAAHAVRAAPISPESRLASARVDLSLAPNRSDLAPDDVRARFEGAVATLRRHLGDEAAGRLSPSTLWADASAHVVRHDLAEPDMRELMIACCHYLGLLPRLRGVDRPARPVEVPVQVLAIDRFDFLALPGEVLVEVGDEWRRLTGNEHAFVIGLANAHHRYLPRALHFAESDAAVRYETVTAGLAPDGVEIALREAAKLRATRTRAAAT